MSKWCVSVTLGFRDSDGVNFISKKDCGFLNIEDNDCHDVGTVWANYQEAKAAGFAFVSSLNKNSHDWYFWVVPEDAMNNPVI